MNRRREASELIQAIVPSVRWSPTAWLVTMFGIAVLGICVFFLSRDEATMLILWGLLGIGYVICLIWLQYRCVHAYYANGFLYRGFFRDAPILFEDVESYALMPIRKSSVQGGMFGTPDAYQYRITFFLKEDFPLKKVTILFAENDDYLVKSLFVELRSAIFRRMDASYQKDKKFDWTPNVRVLDEGMEWSGNAKDASERDVFIPFCDCDVDTCQFRVVPTRRARYFNGFWQTIGIMQLFLQPVSSLLTGTLRTRSEEDLVLHLFRAGGSEPEIKIFCRSPNFYPGYDAFRKIVWEKYGKFLGNSFH